MGLKMVRFDDLLPVDGTKMTLYATCPGYRTERSSVMQSYRPMVVKHSQGGGVGMIFKISYSGGNYNSTLFYLIIEP